MSTSFAGILHSTPSGPALLPLLISSGILAFDLFEALYFSAFTGRTTESQIPSHAISAFWSAALPSALASAIALHGGTAGLAGYVWSGAERGGLLRKYVGWGAFFATAHFGFAYTIAMIVERMIERSEEARKMQRKWLWVHAVRTVATDVPAFLCFLACVWHGWA